MTFTYLCFLLTLHVITVTSAEEGHWCYEIQESCDNHCIGARKWSSIGHCNGQDQSPINIVTKNTKYKYLKPFKFTGYDAEGDYQLSNNGHSAKLTFGAEPEMTISGGGLEGQYKAAQLHFHWGSGDMPGSEHTIDGEKYAAELHIVHTTMSSERSEPSGGSSGETTGKYYAVLGFFIEEATEDNSNYKNIIDALTKIPLEGNSTIVSKVKLQELIPEKLEKFYRYEGSLTTPPCDETVTWTVFHETIKLGKAQMQAFYTKLNYSVDAVMVENFRPVQKLGQRTVFTSGVEAVLSHTRHLLLPFIVAYLASTS